MGGALRGTVEKVTSGEHWREHRKNKYDIIKRFLWLICLPLDLFSQFSPAAAVLLNPERFKWFINPT